MLAESGRKLMVISRIWRWSAARWDGLFSMVSTPRLSHPTCLKKAPEYRSRVTG